VLQRSLLSYNAAKGSPQSAALCWTGFFAGQGGYPQTASSLGENAMSQENTIEQLPSSVPSDLSPSSFSQTITNTLITDEQRFEQLLLLAQVGDAAAQFSVGLCYGQGRGVAKDKVEAVKWYRSVATQGLLEAQCCLSLCYKYGWGVEKDEAESMKWLRFAFAQGVAETSFFVGWCYENGYVVEADEAEAVKAYWFAAAGQGHVRAQARLDEINRRKSAQALSASPKAGIKQEVSSGESTPKQEQSSDNLFKLDAFSNNSSSPSSVTSNSSLTTSDRETKESKPTNLQVEVSQLTADIQQGETAALSKALTTPAAQQSEPLQNYLQSQAIWTVLESEAKPAQKAGQIALLVEAPGVSLLVENAKGQLLVEVALQQAAKGEMSAAVVQTLEAATEQQLNEVVFQAVEEYAQSTAKNVADEKVATPRDHKQSVAADNDQPVTPQQLANLVREHRQAQQVLKQEFDAAASTITAATTPPTARPSLPPRQMSAQQRNLQRKLFLKMAHELISEKFIKSVAIGKGWVEEVLQKKTTATKTAVTAAAGVALSVLLPGVGGLMVSAASAGAEWEYRRRQAKLNSKHTLGITSLKELAMVTTYLEQALLYRYQDFLLQQGLQVFSPDTMKTFVNCLLKRMFLYVEEIDTPEEIRALLGEKLVNLNTQKKTTQAAVPDAKLTESVAAQITENLVAGTSLVELGLLDRFSSGADAVMSCLTLDGSTRELHVSDICHSPAVALAEEAEKTGLLEYEGRHKQGSGWKAGDCGVICISREEAELRGWDDATFWEGSLLIPKAQSDVVRLQAQVKELEQQLVAERTKTVAVETRVETAEARANTAEARASSAEGEIPVLKAEVSGLGQQLKDIRLLWRSLGQQLSVISKEDAELLWQSLDQQLLAVSEVAEPAEAKESKSPTNQRSKGGPGMFDNKPNAAGKPIKPLPPVSSFQPASPKPKSGLPSTPVTPVSPG
jgi:hypothetical protein